MKHLLLVIVLFLFSCQSRKILDDSMNGVWYEIIDTKYYLDETIYDIRSLAETSRHENGITTLVSIDTVIFRYTIEDGHISSIQSFRDTTIYNNLKNFMY